MNFTKSINYNWPSPNWFKISPCFFRYNIRHKKFFKNIVNTFFFFFFLMKAKLKITKLLILFFFFFWMTAKFKIPSFFRLFFIFSISTFTRRQNYYTIIKQLWSLKTLTTKAKIQKIRHDINRNSKSSSALQRR